MKGINLALNKIDGHITFFICVVYSEIGRVRQKIWISP